MVALTNSKLTCVKSGKTLVWKSIKTSSSSSKMDSTTTTEPKPNPSPSASSIDDETKLFPDKVTYNKILGRAISEIKTLPDTSVSQKFTVFSDSNVSKENTADAYVAANIVFSKFGKLIFPDFQSELILSKSEQFEIDSFEASPLLKTWQDLTNSNYLNSRKSEYLTSNRGSYFAFPLMRTGTEVKAMGQFMRIGTYDPNHYGMLFAVCSETFHAIQWGVAGSESGGVWPTWFYEGEMVAIGRILALPGMVTNETYFSFFKYGIPYNKGSTDLSKMEDHDFSPIVYERGEDATYYLLGKYGWKAVYNFMADRNSTLNWHEAFLKNFGVTYSDFYNEVIPFFDWMDYKRANAK